MEQNTNKKKSIYHVQALDRALDIVDLFTFQQRKLNLSDVVAHTGLKKTTAKRLLSNLTDRGYLKQDPQTKIYELGLRLFELGSVVHAGFSVRKAAENHIERLRDQTGLNVLLGQCLEDHLVYVDKREGTGWIKISSSVGEQRPLHFGMLGQVLMADMPMEKVQELLTVYPLEAHTPESITDPERFYQRLADIRRQDYVIETGEAHPGILGIAAPVRDVSGKVVAALGAAIPFPDYTDAKQVSHALELVRQAAADISTELGHQKN
ncbi:IclR family transcriptional regulator [Desulfosarcina ovata subsp. sediminis]|uniref:IclR family transcriptional regulator n=1 Tax=Desulfosarcina ovata subsp. sediminis TaxID=885957 RepID=A0A5K7ZYT0_9BACT|nr:IclR family transcriptional regulator [Desulfosarcina ovata]BBO85271.1 IclR family transcriptional regulator [Desulfosarcina ovata subsp. sediminis]